MLGCGVLFSKLGITLLALNSIGVHEYLSGLHSKQDNSKNWSCRFYSMIISKHNLVGFILGMKEICQLVQMWTLMSSGIRWWFVKIRTSFSQLDSICCHLWYHRWRGWNQEKKTGSAVCIWLSAYHGSSCGQRFWREMLTWRRWNGVQRFTRRPGRPVCPGRWDQFYSSAQFAIDTRPVGSDAKNEKCARQLQWPLKICLESVKHPPLCTKQMIGSRR